MFRFLYIIIFLLIIFSCSNSTFNYPEINTEDVKDNLSDSIVNNLNISQVCEDSLETIEWCELKNLISFDDISEIPSRDSINRRINKLLDLQKQTTPIYKAGKYFFFKNDSLQNHDVLYFKDNSSFGERAVFNPNKLSENGAFTLLNIYFSKKADYLAYSLSESAFDRQKINVFDINNDKKLNDEIFCVKYSNIAWFVNGFFYSNYDMSNNASEYYSKKNIKQRIYYHQIGDNCGNDKVIFSNSTNNGIFYSVKVSHDEKYILISEMKTTQGNILYVSNLKSKKPFFLQLIQSFEYDYVPIDVVSDNIYILTNYEAPNYKVVIINLNSLETGKWEDVIPQKKDVLTQCVIVENRIITHYLKEPKNIMQSHLINKE